MKKGFTLIELLAVILILGIIALIAVPMVYDTIESSEIRASELSAENFIKAVDEDITLWSMKTGDFAENSCTDVGTVLYTLEEDGALPKGKLPNDGYVCIEDGQIGYAIVVFDDLVLECTDGVCKNMAEGGGEEDPDIDFDVEGEDSCVSTVREPVMVYFNPETGTKCTETEYKANIKEYGDSITGLKTGCMKWYAYNYDSSTNKVSMILDHNTSNRKSISLQDEDISYYEGDTEYRRITYHYDSYADGALAEDSSTWNGVEKYREEEVTTKALKHYDDTNYRWVTDTELHKELTYRARYLTFSELEMISKVKINGRLTLDNCTYEEFGDYNYINGIDFYQYKATHISKAHYLFDNTDCNRFGCKYYDEVTMGYYFVNDKSYNNFNAITNAGLVNKYNTSGRVYGVRPVIDINNNVLNIDIPNSWVDDK